jgi:CheY-like chemotaxis protein
MGFTILVVDDEENFRLNLESLLSAHGYEVLSAASLAEAARSSAAVLTSSCST